MEQRGKRTIPRYALKHPPNHAFMERIGWRAFDVLDELAESVSHRE